MVRSLCHTEHTVQEQDNATNPGLTLISEEAAQGQWMLHTYTVHHHNQLFVDHSLVSICHCMLLHTMTNRSGTGCIRTKTQPVVAKHYKMHLKLGR